MKKGYKAFNIGMICNGKQYAENTIFEETGANSCCNAGVMHYCEEPFDCLDYYPLVDDNGNFSEFAEVEPMDEILRDGNKCATKKIKIGAKLKFRDFIKAGIGVLIEVTNPNRISKETKFYDDAQIGSSGDGARIGSSGDGARIGSSGYGAQIGSSGYGAQIGSSGDGARIGSSGDGARIGSSGDGARIKTQGKNSVASAIGLESMIKGEIGNWIVLAEWKEVNGEYKPVCVKAAQIDGENIKADTWYKLKNGELIEA